MRMAGQSYSTCVGPATSGNLVVMIRASLERSLAVLLVSAAAAVTATLAVPRVAHAEPPNARATPVYVLAIWTDDADDQAEALTQSLRSRVRQAQGWSLLETNQSFETLAIALKCPPKPDQGCLTRIGDQLHADHYVWGTMGRKKGPGEVTADMHLWSRGKGDEAHAETYSDNLKDASDESLKQIAAKIFGRLTGGVAGGTLVVHAGSSGGRVLVDGVEKAQLEGGIARVDLGGGPHTVAVRVPGFDAPAQQASVPVGAEQEMNFALSPTPTGPVEGETRSSFPTRRVLMYTALVAGGGLLVGSAVEAGVWIGDSNKSHDDRANVPASVSDVCQAQVNGYAVDACHRSKDALTASELAWTFGGVGAALVGTGLVLMMTDHGTREPGHDAGTTAAPRPHLDVLPVVGARGGAVDLRVSF
jgi:hypothetical protein